MSDWQIGDLAVVVRAAKAGTRPDAGKPMRLGQIFRVEAIVPFPGCLGLVLEGHYSDHWSRSYNAISFRKIRPDEQSGEIEDWNLLLETVKRKEPVAQRGSA